MFSPGDRVLVGLSGGADSVALVHLLYTLRDRLGITLCAAHVNHSIRGEAALQDQELARRLCEQLAIPFYIHTADVPALSREWGMSEETCGRKVRYDFFHAIPQVDKIATAHTADDNAETVLMNLIRGSGLGGLSGIPPVRGTVVRPLLECTRKMIEQYCRDHSLVFANDETNQQDRYTRNRIRHQLIPFCLTENPGFLQTVSRCTTLNRKDFDYLCRIGQQLVQESRLDEGYSVPLLLQSDPVPLAYAIKHLLEQHGNGVFSAVHREQLLFLLQKGDGACSLPGVTAQVKQGVLTFYREPIQPTNRFCQPVTLNHPILVQGRQITLRQGVYHKNFSSPVHNLLTYIVADGDTIGKNLMLRNRQPGDAITLPGRNCTKTLKKLFNEMKLSARQRDSALILADEKGILWVEGVGCDKRCQPTDSTGQVLQIEITEDANNVQNP